MQHKVLLVWPKCGQTEGETCNEEVATIDPLFIFGGHWPVWTHVWPTVHTRVLTYGTRYIIQAIDISLLLHSCDIMIFQKYFILQTLEDLRPLMRTGISKLGLPPTEPMNIESMEFAQGAPPVIVKASFSNVVVKGLSNFITNFIEVDPTSR